MKILVCSVHFGPGHTAYLNAYSKMVKECGFESALYVDRRYMKLFNDIDGKCIFNLQEALDFKPDILWIWNTGFENMLDEHNHPKISDFGLAFFANAQLVNDSVMPFYCSHGAPELRNSQSYPNILTDIYAFGVTFFRMVNNISDWNSAQMYAPIKHAIETGEFGSRCLYQGYVPGKIIRIIAKACNPNPQKRYQTASEMRNALLKLKPWLNWHPVRSNENKFNWLAEDYFGNVYSAEI